MIMSYQLGLDPGNADKAIQSKVPGLGQSGRHETKHIDYIFTFESWRSNLPQVFLFPFVRLTVTLGHRSQSTLRNRRKMRWKLQILSFLTIHFSSKSDKYSIIYDPLKLKFFREKFLEFSVKIKQTWC